MADPDFAGKISGVESGNIRPCLACSEGCLGNVRQGKGLGCVVNPTVNHKMPTFKKKSGHEKIAVVGGGLARMQAAIVLKERDFDVTIFEK